MRGPCLLLLLNAPAFWLHFMAQGELFVASSGNRVHLYNAEDEFLSAYWGSACPVLSAVLVSRAPPNGLAC